MQNERKRILDMLENGTITAEEALNLLVQIDSSAEGTEGELSTRNESRKSADKEGSSKSAWSNASAEEFMEDLRKDLTTAGDQFMQFMQGAVQKVKGFDVENPFGSASTFEHTLQKDASDIKELIVDINNGKISIVPGETDDITATFSVKTYTMNSEEDVKKEFLDRLICVADDKSFRVSSNSKTVQVNTVLTVPKKEYNKISVRLLNGGFEMTNLNTKKIRVKTTNGKINMSYVKAESADLETLNGEIRLLSFESDELEAQTLNGLVYVDGKIKETEARTLNGAITVTTTHENPEKIEVKSMGGNIELFVPSHHSLEGSITSTIGSLSLKLPDVEKTSNQDQLLHRSLDFEKEVSGSTSKLQLEAESKTGSILVCYSPEKEA